MRTWLMVVGGLSLWAAVANGQERDLPPQTCAHAQMAAAKACAGLSTPDGVPAPRLDRSADTDVQHYWLDIDVNPTTVWITGSNTMTIRSCVDNLTTFIFRLQSNFTMSAVQVGAAPVAWTRLDVANVEVTLDRPYNVGEVFTLYVAYSGHPQQNQGLGNITFRTRNGAPEVFTLSEPWLSYTWWPGKDDLMDKTTADLWFTVPNTLVVGSNGLLQGVDTIQPNKLRYRWLSIYPAPDYLYSLAATNYHEFDDTWTYGDHSMPLQFFIYPEHDTPTNRQDWLDISGALTTYSDLFGLYPFINEKYGMAEFGWGGGMEHQTLTSIIGDFGWESGLVHELSHQWWGDNVTCATWHDIWLNEGFAVYSEALWYEHKPGSSGEPALHQTMAQRRPGFVFDSVYCYDITNVNRVFDYNITYLKAGWVLHMLRHVVGDANFYAILAAYRAAYEGSSATTDDFRAVGEAVTGRDLAWFFAQWVYDQGAPAYEVAWRQFVLDNQRYVEVYISQVQGNSPPVFTMPMDIQVTQSGIPTIYTVWNDATSENLLFPVAGGNISSLSFDPKPWILRTSRTTIPWVEGPPKIVTMNPAPNATALASGVSSFEVVFHKPVVAAASDFSLVGVRSGPVPVTYAYNATRNAVTLTPFGALATDTYTLTVADTIVDVASGQALDGELVKPDGPNPLPSGDGIPGGSAVVQFFLTRVGDLNCDGLIDFDDISPFVLALSDPASYAAEVPGCPLANADANGDGTINFDDIDPFVELLGAP